jgi:uncharacterized protein
MAPTLSPLMDALYHGRADEAQRLLAERGSDSLSIHEAAAMGVLPRIKQLVGEDPASLNAWSEDGFQPLGLACFFGHRKPAEYLLSKGAEVNTPARHEFHVTALHAALAGPEPGIAAVLVAAGADVNARQQGGSTPLHTSAFNGLVDLTTLLLEHGADPSVQDDQGRTPAAIARERGHTSVVDLLQRNTIP